MTRRTQLRSPHVRYAHGSWTELANRWSGTAIPETCGMDCNPKAQAITITTVDSHHVGFFCFLRCISRLAYTQMRRGHRPPDGNALFSLESIPTLKRFDYPCCRSFHHYESQGQHQHNLIRSMRLISFLVRLTSCVPDARDGC